MNKPLLMLLLLTACSAPTPMPTASPANPTASPVTSVSGDCPAQTVETSSWQTVSEKGFSFKLPPDWQKQTLQGFDSLVGRWQTSENRFVYYDYGGYSSTLDEGREMLKDYGECTITTGTLKARVISGFDATGNWNGGGPKHVVAGAWRNITPGLHLSFTTASDKAEDKALLYTILRSVRFDP